MIRRVLFVINTLGQAGAEVALAELLKRLDDPDLEISLFVLLGQGELIKKIPPFVRLLNKRYSCQSVLSKQGGRELKKTVLRTAFHHAAVLRLLPYLLGNAADMAGKKRFQADKLLWRLVSDGAERFDEEYDLAVSFLEGGSAYYVADHVKAKRKAAFLHIDYGKAGYTRKLDRDCYLKFDRIFCVSNEVREHFIQHYPECEKRIRVFENFIDPDEIRRKAALPGGFDDGYDGIRLLTVGNLSYHKGYDLAIEAMTLLKKRGCQMRWYVIGEGPERKRLEKLIEKHGLQKDFILLGKKSNPYPYYAQTDLYVHASRFEGKSIAIREAQVLGCAILASDCSGNREQICNGKDGILCPPVPQDLASAVMLLAGSRKLREKYAAASRGKPAGNEENIRMLYELLQ